MALLFILMSFVVCAACQVFHFQALPTGRFPGLQVDQDGNAFLSRGRQLYRLNNNLQLEETRNLTSDSVNISLSSDGRWLVVCLTDLSCEVYNTTNLSAPPVFRRENAIRSADNVALFAADDSFYVGSISSGTHPQITLGQYRLNGAAAENNYDITREDFERNFYSGFVTNNYTYYFAVDNSPVRVRGIRVMRVCHNSNFSALHELTLGCGGRTPSYNTRISGISIVNNLAGMMEPTVILSRNRPASSQNYICLYNLSMIDSMMLEKYQSCSAAMFGTQEQITLAWRTFSHFCDTFQPARNICHFMSSILKAVDDTDNLHYNGVFLIHLSLQNYIRSSVAVVYESFSFVFVSFTDINGSSFIAGFDVRSTNFGILLSDNDAFSRRVMPSPVGQLQWQTGSDFIYAVSSSSVIKIPIADCTSNIDCNTCLGDGNPLCGWCLLENKCSRKEECRNFNINWIRSNKTSLMECLTISVSPLRFVVDNPQIITISLSRTLPVQLEDNVYKCLFTSNNGTEFTVEAIGSEATYTCNITSTVLMNHQLPLATVVYVSLVSSLIGVPFTTSTTPFIIYHCEYALNCSQCLQTDNACGWCVYNKVCSGTAEPCINEVDGYLKENQAKNEDYTAVCPLLDRPTFGESYLQPVQTNRNLLIITRSLPPEIDEFKYKCSVNGIVLPAVYSSPTLLTCVVHEGKLTLEHGRSQQTTDLIVYWNGYYRGQLINHKIDHVVPVNVTLYDCAGLASCCSSCLYQNISNGFECGWCERSGATLSDSCSYIGECDSTVVRMSSNCPAPSITDFTPKSGHADGGTIITITGRELGVTFGDFTTNSISIGDTVCIPVENDYILGQQILCRTVKGSPGVHAVTITLPSGIAVSRQVFTLALPEIHGVDPTVGPVAGGTKLTVWGLHLNIGNLEYTRVYFKGAECTIHNTTNIEDKRIVCITSSLNTPTEENVVLSIDQATVTNASVLFSYVPNPEFLNVTPSNTIVAGGIKLIFIGTNMDVVQQPVLQITEDLDTINTTRCTLINSTAISCVTPPLTRLQPLGDSDGLNYTIIMDNAPGPDLTMENLQIHVLPNPGGFVLITRYFDQTKNGSLKILGDNLHSVPAYEIRIEVGGEPCIITAVDVHNNLLSCTPPSESPGGSAKATVTVFIGAYLRYNLRATFNYDQTPPNSLTASTISVITVTSVAVIIVGAVLMSIATLIAVRIFKIIKANKKKGNNVLKRHDNLLPLSLSSLPIVNSSSQLSQTSQVSLPLLQVSQRLIIPGKQLHILNKKIGHGEFGDVYEAQLLRWKGRRKKLTVAVKTLKYLHSDKDKEKMIAEINKMENLQHPNVMPLIGVCFDAGSGMSIVMPFMTNGSLLSYLKKQRANVCLKSNANPSRIMSVKKLLLRMCHQVAKGMEYLAMKGFVHRDLAARNCLLDNKGNVKVGDFGLTEDIYTKGYFRQGKDEPVKLPFKWMAPESLRDGLFSEKSDVWSFGITCWEVFSGGRIPYSAVDAISILSLHEKGTRLNKPANAACTNEEYSMMDKCWALDPEDRPSFKQLREGMDELLQTAAGYLELKMVLVTPNEDETTDDSGYEITENPFKEEFNCLTIMNPLALTSQGEGKEEDCTSTEGSMMKKMVDLITPDSNTTHAMLTEN